MWWSTVSFFVCFLPLWILIFAKYAFNPQGFWQKIVFVGAGVYFFGFVQVLGIVALFFCLAAIWGE